MRTNTIWFDPTTAPHGLSAQEQGQELIVLAPLPHPSAKNWARPPTGGLKGAPVSLLADTERAARHRRVDGALRRDDRLAAHRHRGVPTQLRRVGTRDRDTQRGEGVVVAAGSR